MLSGMAWNGCPRSLGICNWRQLAWERLKSDADWTSIRTDVERFVLREAGAESVTAEAVREALRV
jgi:hypothetical protein